MKKSSSGTIYNYLIIFIIFVQICYFLTSDPEYLKEKIHALISISTYGILNVLFDILLIYALFIISQFIGKKVRLNVYLLFAFIVVTLINYSEYILKTTRTFSIEEQELDKVLEEANTGDLLLFRSYHSRDVADFVFMRFFHSLFSNVYFSHIGMIVKDKNETYICESTAKYQVCHYHKKYKNGPMFSNAKKVVKEYPGRVYLSKNNLYQFINEQQIYNSFKQFENQYFLQNGIWCVSVISNILSDLEVMMRPYIIFLGYDFIDPKNYKVEFKNTKNILIKNNFILGQFRREDVTKS
jgi:hypothetical protein